MTTDETGPAVTFLGPAQPGDRGAATAEQPFSAEGWNPTRPTPRAGSGWEAEVPPPPPSGAVEVAPVSAPAGSEVLPPPADPAAGASWPPSANPPGTAWGSWPPSQNAPSPAGRIRPGRTIAIVVGSVLAAVVLLAIAIPTFLQVRSDVHPAFTPPGYRAFTDRTDRFGLAVPDSWDSVDLNSPGATAALQQMEQDNPAIAALEGGSGASASALGLKFLAGNDLNTVNVIVKPVFESASALLPQLQAELPSIYQKLGGTLVSNALIRMDGREAIQATVEVQYREPNGASTYLTETQDILVGNDFAYTVTLAGSSPELATIAATFDIGS